MLQTTTEVCSGNPDGEGLQNNFTEEVTCGRGLHSNHRQKRALQAKRMVSCWLKIVNEPNLFKIRNSGWMELWGKRGNFLDGKLDKEFRARWRHSASTLQAEGLAGDLKKEAT